MGRRGTEPLFWNQFPCGPLEVQKPVKGTATGGGGSMAGFADTWTHMFDFDFFRGISPLQKSMKSNTVARLRINQGIRMDGHTPVKRKWWRHGAVGIQQSRGVKSKELAMTEPTWRRTKLEVAWLERSGWRGECDVVGMCPIWYAETIRYRNKQKGKEAQRNSRYACSVSSRLRATRGELQESPSLKTEAMVKSKISHPDLLSEHIHEPPGVKQDRCVALVKRYQGMLAQAFRRCMTERQLFNVQNDYRREFSWVVDAANKVRGRWRGGSHEGKEPAGKPKAHTARSPLGSWNTPSFWGVPTFNEAHILNNILTSRALLIDLVPFFVRRDMQEALSFLCDMLVLHPFTSLFVLCACFPLARFLPDWGAAIVSIGLAMPLVVVLMGLVVGATSRRK
ncbi:hypothetical protein EDB84DRAFT_1441320 [Lactarius hengduanensis]|nr:hypothetical protein EDB84DRAFT_1441320 [Lactarius hengduanensis]